MIKNYGVYISALTTIVFWASAFPAVKYSLNYYSPESVMLLRFLTASVAVGIYCVIARVQLPDKRDLPAFAIAGAVGIFVYMWLFNTGTSYVTAGLSSFIIGACPLVTLLLSIIFLKERPGKLGWLGILISFLGLALVASTGIQGASINMGIILLLGAVFCHTIYIMMLRGRLKKYSPMINTSFTIFFATALMLAFLPLFAREFPSAPMAANLVCIYLGIFPAAFAYFTWNWALSRAEKTVHVTSFLYLTPFLSAVMSFFWLGERLELIVVIGGVIIVAGLVLANIRSR